MKKLTLSIIIPAYNEAENVEDCILSVQKALLQLPEHLFENNEVIVVDDHSLDGTFDKVSAIANQLQHSLKIRLIRLAKRSGSHIALRAGLDHALGDAAFCLAADGQDDPATLKLMVEKWHKDSGAQVVWALRAKRDEGVKIKLFAIIFYKILSWTVQNQHHLDLSRADFYLLDRKVITAVQACQEMNTSLFGLILSLGFRQESVEYQRRERTRGQSGWNFKSRCKLAGDWICSFSSLPLKFSYFLCCFFFLLSVLMIFFQNLLSANNLLSLVFFITCLQFLILGFLGTYIGRIHNETQRRPLYFIEKDRCP